uniref:Uncharacterized protein n=1 Tax=Mola mola TaxID=94237 RepID=A0A3Q4BG98_MOLML
MSSVGVDENRGVCPQGKHNSSIDDIFALEQPTGRPSILRQTENLPSKTVPKGAKVCFQTPRRDPLTKRILSPTKTVKMTSVDECTKAKESLNMDKTNDNLLEFSTEMSSYPDDDMPIQSKGGYDLDFDNLDGIDPFQGSNKMMLSPAKPRPVTLIIWRDLSPTFLRDWRNTRMLFRVTKRFGKYKHLPCCTLDTSMF